MDAAAPIVSVKTAGDYKKIMTLNSPVFDAETL